MLRADARIKEDCDRQPVNLMTIPTSRSLAVVALCTGLAVHAFGAATVIPSAFASAEGNSSSSSLFQTNPASIQAYYSEAFLTAAGITPGTMLTGIAYRRNSGGTVGPAGDTTIADYNIFMSQSFATPAQMTTTFANNVVGAQTQVHSGSVTFAANSFPGGGTPNAFGQVINFKQNYSYTGGSLLIEIRRSARTGNTTSFNTDVDSTAATQAGARWLFNTTTNAATTGTMVNGGQIFQLQTQAVPEPATMFASATMFAFGAGALALLRRRRRAA